MRYLVRRLSLVLVSVAAFEAGAADVEAEQARIGGSTRSHWNFGPFFEYRRADPGPSAFWAVRPFYSHADAPSSDTFACDVLWPLAA